MKKENGWSLTAPAKSDLMKRVWVVKYYDDATDLMNIDRIFDNESAANLYIDSGYNPGRYFKLEFWKVYSTWPEEWKK